MHSLAISANKSFCFLVPLFSFLCRSVFIQIFQSKDCQPAGVGRAALEKKVHWPVTVVAFITGSKEILDLTVFNYLIHHRIVLVGHWDHLDKSPDLFSYLTAYNCISFTLGIRQVLPTPANVAAKQTVTTNKVWTFLYQCPVTGEYSFYDLHCIQH